MTDSSNGAAETDPGLAPRAATSHSGREGLGRPCRGQGRGWGTRSDLHRPAPPARGDEPPAVRRAARRGSSAPPPRSHDRHGGPQHPDARDRPPDPGPHQSHADRGPAPQRRRIRCAPALARRRRAGHRPRRRTAAGPDDARSHGGLRRLAHLDARSVRRDRLRHRHQRGRARDGDADPPVEALQDDGDHGRGNAEGGRHGEGHHPRRHRPDRHRGGQGYISSTAARRSARSQWRVG